MIYADKVVGSSVTFLRVNIYQTIIIGIGTSRSKHVLVHTVIQSSFAKLVLSELTLYDVPYNQQSGYSGFALLDV